MALPKPLFWIEPLKKTVWEPFWWIILLVLILWIPFLRVWWWVFLPLMLATQFEELYHWWMEWDYAYAGAKWIVLEMVPPKETMVPVKAMEDIFNVLWPMYDQASFKDRWIDGELPNGPFWASYEIASIEGQIHFYIRVLAQFKISVESAFYNHYPEVEIREVPDYAHAVPQTIPNEEWDMYGEDFDFKQPDAIPIKTYEKAFETQGEKISAEEKRMDPIISLLESMSRLGAGEQYWVQLVATPITDSDEPEWRKKGMSYIAKLTKRPEKKTLTLTDELMGVGSQLILGPIKEGSGEKAKYSWTPSKKTDSVDREMVLTPTERDVLTEVERKLTKPVFRTTIRAMYVARRENWNPAHRLLMRSYMAHFNAPNMNQLMFQGKTRASVKYFMKKQRNLARVRKMFRHAVLRFPPLFPERMSDDLQPILSAEEMATLWHFPLRMSGMLTPSMSSGVDKKSGPPSNLPTG
jgi:hypothetical protein